MGSRSGMSSTKTVEIVVIDNVIYLDKVDEYKMLEVMERRQLKRLCNEEILK